MTEYRKIPTTYQVGGQEIKVCRVDRADNNDLGCCSVAKGIIEIAAHFNRDEEQSESAMTNTFYHELTHSILTTMGEFELNQNEKFVSCFSGFLTEAMSNAYFKEDDNDRLPDTIR